MSRTLYEAVPVATELDQRLRRLESRVGTVEAALAAPPAAVPPATPAPVPVVPGRPDPPWAEIGSRLEALALKLKLHYEQAGGERAPHALDELRDRVQDAFAAAGNAFHDDAVRSDVREVGVMVGEAVADALTTVGDDMREAVRRTEAGKGGTP
jgi:hypothetical protein